MIWYFKSNQKQNNRNRKEIKERERRKLPGAHLPGPARPSPSPLPLSSSSSPEGPRRGARPRGLGHLLLPLATSCFLLDAPVTPRASPTPSRSPSPSSSPPGPHPLLCSPLAHTTERSSPSSSPYPWPPATPSLADALKGSASTPSSSSPSHAPPEAPNILSGLVSYLGPAGRRRPNSWNSGRSRASRAPLRDRCELLHPFPLFPASFDRRSRRPLYGRNAPPPELNVGVAPVTIWSRACAQRAPRIA